jgi:hypothetical protein
MTNVDDIKNAITYVDNSDRELWVRMGAALKTELGDAGFDIFNDWSQTAANYDQNSAKSVWKSLKPGFVNINSLFYEARQEGYKPNAPFKPLNVDELKERERAAEEARLLAEKERQDEMAKAKEEAQNKYSSLSPIRDINHDYLVNKGINERSLLRQVRRDQDNLIIPMKKNGEIVGLQSINKTGRKSFTKGMELNGSSLVMGSWANRDKGIVLTEGYATAASIHKATGLTTIVCFAGFNLKAVAKRLPKDLDVPIIIASDNDEINKKTGKRPGYEFAKAAKEVLGDKATVIEPNFTKEDFEKFEKLYGSRPSDFNDLHKLHGLEAVNQQLNQTQEIVMENKQNLEWTDGIDRTVNATKIGEIYSETALDKEDWESLDDLPFFSHAGQTHLEIFKTENGQYIAQEHHLDDMEKRGAIVKSVSEVKEFFENSDMNHSNLLLEKLYEKAGLENEFEKLYGEYLDEVYEKNAPVEELANELPKEEIENSIAPAIDKIIEQRAAYMSQSKDVEAEVVTPKKEEERTQPEVNTESNSQRDEELATEEQPELKAEETGKERIDIEKELSKPIVIDHDYDHPPGHLKSKYFFTEKGDYINDAGDVFFKDQGASLKTAKNDMDTVQDMLEVAETKGWSSIQLNGSKEFKRIAYIEATVRGIDAYGYKPNEKDLAIIDQLREERSINIINKADKPTPETEKSDKEPEQGQSEGEEKIKVKTSPFEGELMEHGAAPYKFDDKKSMSYYAHIKDENGVIHEHWGKELSTAIESSGAEIGEKIELVNLGKQAVQVEEKVYDQDGNFSHRQSIETYRNEWEIIREQERTEEPEIPLAQQEAEKDKLLNQNRAPDDAVIEDSKRVDAHGADIPMAGVGGQEIRDELQAFMNGLTPKQQGLNKSSMFVLKTAKTAVQSIVSGLDKEQRDTAIRNFNEKIDSSINGDRLDLGFSSTKEQPAPTLTREHEHEKEEELER